MAARFVARSLEHALPAEEGDHLIGIPCTGCAFDDVEVHVTVADVIDPRFIRWITHTLQPRVASKLTIEIHK